jgi:hypothetical protein
MELRMTLRSGQRDGYNALFNAAADALRDVGRQTRALKECELGCFGVLHTWGRDPQVYHPHVHFVVPGGAVLIGDDGRPTEWRATTESFLMHHPTLIRVYKGKLTDNLRECGLYDDIPESAWWKKSVVDIKPVGDGRAVLKYLAPYMHRVAISDKRIVAIDDKHVTYTVKPSGTNHTVIRQVEGVRFVGSFLQHVLPRGFQKVRYYGWQSPNSRIELEEVRWLACLLLGFSFVLAARRREAESAHLEPYRCEHCGGELAIVRIVHESFWQLANHPLAYLDSG